MDLLEIVKTVITLSLSVSSLSLTILIFKWTKSAHVQIANSTIDIITREIEKMDQRAITDSLYELHQKVDKLLKEKRK